MSHKAPSAKRCIKTAMGLTRTRLTVPCHKAPSAKRCIKTRASSPALDQAFSESQSTERQKVH